MGTLDDYEFGIEWVTKNMERSWGLSGRAGFGDTQNEGQQEASGPVSGKGSPQATLNQWNDSLNKSKPLILFEPNSVLYGCLRFGG